MKFFTPQGAIDPPKVAKRGRPPLGAPPGSTVSTWIPEPAHDQLIAMARQQRRSVSALVRDLVLREVD